MDSKKFSFVTTLKVLPISNLGTLIQAELMILMGVYGTEFLDKKKLRYVIWAAKKFFVVNNLKVLPVSKLGILIQPKSMIWTGIYGTEFW
jgi:hypothetical protein